MIKMVNVSIAVILVGALTMLGASPSLAKVKGKVKSVKHPSYQSYQQTVRRPVPVAAVVPCRHGVWDAYALRCDAMKGGD
jgi:hypothetical protein